MATNSNNDDDDEEEQALYADNSRRIREIKLNNMKKDAETIVRQALIILSESEEEPDSSDEIDQQRADESEEEAESPDEIVEQRVHELEEEPDSLNEIVEQPDSSDEIVEQPADELGEELDSSDEQHARGLKAKILEMKFRLEEVRKQHEEETDEKIAVEESDRLGKIKGKLSKLNSTTEQRVRGLVIQITKKNEQISIAEKELEKLIAELQILETKRKTQQNDFVEVIGELSKLTKEIKRSQEELQILRQQLHLLTVERDRYQMQLNQQKSLLHQIQMKLRDLQQQLAELESEKQILTKRRNELVQALDIAKKDRSILEKEIADIDVLRTEVEGQVSVLEGEIIKSNEFIQTLLTKIQETYGQLNSTQDELQEQNNQLHQSEMEQQHVEMDIKRLESSILWIEQMKNDLGKREQQINIKIDEKKCERQEVETVLKIIEPELQQLQITIERLNNECAALQDGFTQSTNQLNQFEEEQRQAHNRVQGAEEALRHAQAEVQRVQAELKQVIEELRTKRTELVQAELNTARYQTVVTQKQSELTRINGRLTRLDGDVNTAKTESNAAAALLNPYIKSLHEATEAELKLQEEVENQGTIVREAQDRLNECRRLEREAKQNLDDAKREESKARAKVKALKNKLRYTKGALGVANGALAASLALAVPILGTVTAIGATTAAAGTAIGFFVAHKKAKSKLRKAETKREEVASAYEEAQKAEHNAEQNALLALIRENPTLTILQGRLDHQKVVKNTAQQQVNQQPQTVARESGRCTDREQQLLQTEDEPGIKIDEFHQIQMEYQIEPVEQLRRRITDLEGQKQQTLQILPSIYSAVQNAQSEHHAAETSLQGISAKVIGQQPNVHETHGLLDEKQQEIEVKQAEYTLKQKVVQEMKNQLILIDLDISLASTTRAKLEAEKEAQEKLLRAELDRLGTLHDAQQRLKVQVDAAHKQKEQLTEQIVDLKQQIDAQNAAIKEKDRVSLTTTVELHTKQQQKANLESQYARVTILIEKMNYQIEENGRHLAEHEESINLTERTIQEREIDRESVETSIKEIEENLRQTNALPERLSKEIHEKQVSCDQKTTQHDQLRTRVDKNQAERRVLDAKIVNVDNQLESRRESIANTDKILTKLKLGIQNIKKWNRNANVNELQHQSKQVLNQHNHHRRRQIQQQVLRQ